MIAKIMSMMPESEGSLVVAPAGTADRLVPAHRNVAGSARGRTRRTAAGPARRRRLFRVGRTLVLTIGRPGAAAWHDRQPRPTYDHILHTL
jgi:hypothetical protein